MFFMMPYSGVKDVCENVGIPIKPSVTKNYKITKQHNFSQNIKPLFRLLPRAESNSTFFVQLSSRLI